MKCLLTNVSNCGSEMPEPGRRSLPYPSPAAGDRQQIASDPGSGVSPESDRRERDVCSEPCGRRVRGTRAREAGWAVRRTPPRLGRAEVRYRAVAVAVCCAVRSAVLCGCGLLVGALRRGAVLVRWLSAVLSRFAVLASSWFAVLASSWSRVSVPSRSSRSRSRSRGGPVVPTVTAERPTTLPPPHRPTQCCDHPF